MKAEIKEKIYIGVSFLIIIIGCVVWDYTSKKEVEKKEISSEWVTLTDTLTGTKYNGEGYEIKSVSNNYEDEPAEVEGKIIIIKGFFIQIRINGGIEQYGFENIEESTGEPVNGVYYKTIKYRITKPFNGYSKYCSLTIYLKENKGHAVLKDFHDKILSVYNLK